MAVFVVDRHKKPLMPCSEKRARKLLARGRARVHRLMPFAIRLVDRTVNDSVLQPVKIKLDPGSKTTGIAVVRESATIDAETGEIRTTVHVLNLFEIQHRGQQISESLAARRQMRRRRRGHLRYRKPRFLNRGNKGKGWIAPSLQHRVDTVSTWVNRFQRLAPITGIAQELVRFDVQQMENPEISGVEYQQGTLAGYETREYLLNKWGRECAYCGAKSVPLQIEHIQPRTRGGSNRVSNLTLACQPCNQQKGAQEIKVFLAKDPKRLARIQAQAKAPLKDAAAVNSTRWALFNTLKTMGLPVTTGSGGRTKFNRVQLHVPKTHGLDAACVGEMDEIRDWNKPTLAIKATGRGSYQRTRLDAYGFPRGYLTRQKRIKGFQTGDRVKAEVTKGKKTGSYLGRVAVRASGSFSLQTAQAVIQGVSYRYCKVIQRADGYGYSQPLNPNLLGAMSMMSARAEEPGPDGLLTQELKVFVATLQSAVQSDSPEKVAPLIQFPLRVNEAPGKSHSVTARRFSAEYGKIFTPAVKAAVLQQVPDDIFRNANGAMLGNGEVWISGVCRNPDCQVAPPKVTAINLGGE